MNVVLPEPAMPTQTIATGDADGVVPEASASEAAGSVHEDMVTGFRRWGGDVRYRGVVRWRGFFVKRLLG
jgi:hypothetical protein